MSIDNFSYFVAVLIVLMQAGIVILAGAILFRKASWAKKVLSFVKDNTFFYGFLVAFGGVVGSLMYSDFFGLPPCELCWWQRVLLYPQVVILGLATVFRHKRAAALYSVVFSVAGSLTALYQIIIQSFPIESAFCEVGALGADCSERYFEMLGYITIPVMSGTAFALITLLSLVYLLEDDVPWYAKVKELFYDKK